MARSPDVPEAPASSPAADNAPTAPSGPPWRYGRANARFTLTLYADLECPYCKGYYPRLTGWVDRHPDANLQWHHLPLAAHEPAAAQLARLAECAGEDGGHAAFFTAIGWVYQHSRGAGQGLPTDLHYPGLTSAMQTCLDSNRSQNRVIDQANEALHSGITATPTLRVADHQTGKSLVLQGPVEGDALLSALDLIATDEPPATTSSVFRTPVAPRDDAPR